MRLLKENTVNLHTYEVLILNIWIVKHRSQYWDLFVKKSQLYFLKVTFYPKNLKITNGFDLHYKINLYIIYK